MRISVLTLTTALLITSTLSASLPTPLLAIHPTLSPRAPPPWSYPIPSTAIHLTGTVGATIGATIFRALTSAAADFLTYAVGAYGGADALIPHGEFRYTDHDTHAMIHLRNANNHQLTWKVVTAAVDALGMVPELGGEFAADFRIFDGGNQVGTGELWRMAG